MLSSLVVILVINENRVLALECKREPPVPAHPHGPVPLQVAPEWVLATQDLLAQTFV